MRWRRVARSDSIWRESFLAKLFTLVGPIADFSRCIPPRLIHPYRVSYIGKQIGQLSRTGVITTLRRFFAPKKSILSVIEI